MPPILDLVDSALGELSQQPWGDDSPIHNHMKTFKDGLRFLTRFLDCIHEWSDAEEIAPHLGSLATKIEASIQKIGGEFLEKMNHDKWASFFTAVSFNLGGTFEKRASKWVDDVSNLNAMIGLLKPQIAEACDILSIHSVQSHSPTRDFGEWKKFIRSTYLYLWDVESNFDAHDRQPEQDEIRFVWTPSLFQLLLDNLTYCHLENRKVEEFLIKVGSATIHCALLSCHWWARNCDSKIGKDVITALSDLQQRIWFTNPEFVDMIFIILKASWPESTIAESLVPSLIPSTIFPSLPHWELVSILHHHFKEPTQIFLLDIKQLLMEIAYLHHSISEVRDESVAPFLRAKIWLIKLSIILRETLTADDICFMFDDTDSITRVAKEIKEASEGSSINGLNQIWMLMEEVGEKVEPLTIRLHWRFDRDENLKESSRILVNNLLLKTLFVKEELLFMKLHDSSDGLVASFKDRIESLHEGLKIMISSVIYQPEANLKDRKQQCFHIEAVASRVISHYLLILTQNITEEIIQNMYSSLSDLLDEINLIMKELRDTYLHVPRSNFPKINPVGFLDSLLSKLRELLDHKAGITEPVITKQQIAEILRHLEFFQLFLQGISEQDIMFQELKDLGARVTDLAYEAEYLVDSITIGKEAGWHNMIWLYHFLRDIRHIKIQVSENQVKRTVDVSVHNLAQTNKHMISRATIPRIDEDVVSLIDQEELIVDRLIGGSPQRDIVSIVGMPGIGKTTLAKKVYSSPVIVPRFHIRSWCCISEIFKKREVLLEILSHIAVLTNDIIGMHDEDLEVKLYRLLKKKRYFIVMDDMWNTEALDDLRSTLPDDENGSRLLITSRHHHVALKANPHADPHRLRQLSDAESWNLLQKKIFHEELCPKELREIGEEIAKSCKGLPLAIVTIAGLLQRIDRQHNRWKEITKDLTSQIVHDPEEQFRQVLELSYKHLPDCLKACFLYFGAFLEDQDIPARKLMQLWIAEGFVKQTECKSLEDLADDYLKDLIGRSLVIFSQRRSRGGVKACRIHDVLRKMCQSKAKEDNFIQVITESIVSKASIPDLYYVFNADSGNPSISIKYEDHRLCFCSTRKHFIESRPSGPHVRSLLCFATTDKDPRCPYDISFIFHNFRLLKVLDLECINMGTSFPEGLELLMQLRYLAVAGYIASIPSSMANLWNLETLVVKGLKGRVNLPDTIWCLKKLRHVHVSDAVISLHDGQHGNSSQLAHLVTLSSPYLCFGKETDYILGQFPNLRKLKCIFPEYWDISQNCNQFPRLEVLTRLESLKISYYGQALHPGELNFPMNLKKLTLSDFRLPWNKISVIGQLPFLEVLKLLSWAFEGESWDMMEGEFCELKYLRLDTLNIAKWNACCDPFPKLQQLVLRCCKKLEEIPLEIGEISTLDMINVQWCGDLIEESLREIREAGDEKLKVFFNFAELDLSST